MLGVGVKLGELKAMSQQDKEELFLSAMRGDKDAVKRIVPEAVTSETE